MTPSREILKEDGKEEKERRSLVRLEATESVRRILHEAAGLLQSSSKESEARLEILKHVNCPSVPWRVVLTAVQAIRTENGKQRQLQRHQVRGGPWMQDICKGARLLYPEPPKRERNPELVKRLEVIKKELERKKYAEMVQDIDPTRAEYVYMSSYKDQLGLGLNVVVVMATLFGLGYFVGIAWGDESAKTESRGGANILPLCLGLAGAFAGLLLETALFIIRFRRREEEESKRKRQKRKQTHPHEKRHSKLKEN